MGSSSDSGCSSNADGSTRRLRRDSYSRHSFIAAYFASQIHDTAKLVGEEKRLFASGGDGALEEVAVVYFRCG